MKQLLRILMLALACGFPNESQAETSFTYQGRLGNAGVPANGPHEIALHSFDAEGSGRRVSTVCAVTHGLPMP